MLLRDCLGLGKVMFNPICRVMELLGLRPEEEDPYGKVLAAVADQRLGPGAVTNKFVLAMSSLVELKGPGGHGSLSPHKLSIKKFCHLIVKIGDPVKFLQYSDVSTKLMRMLWRKQELEALEERVRADPALAHAIWEPFRRLFPDLVAALPDRVGGEVGGEGAAGEASGGGADVEEGDDMARQARYDKLTVGCNTWRGIWH